MHFAIHLLGLVVVIVDLAEVGCIPAQRIRIRPGHASARAQSTSETAGKKRRKTKEKWRENMERKERSRKRRRSLDSRVGLESSVEEELGASDVVSLLLHNMHPALVSNVT